MRKVIKKFLSAVMTIILFITTITLPPFLSAGAGVNLDSTIFEVISDNTILVDPNDSNRILYKSGSILLGSIKVKYNGNEIAPRNNNGHIEYVLEGYSSASSQLVVEVYTEDVDNYPRPNSYSIGTMSGQQNRNFDKGNNTSITLTENQINIFGFTFGASNNGNDGPGMNTPYPIVAYFGDDPNGVESNNNNKIIIPSNWTSGKIMFKAKICTATDGAVTPNNGICDGTSSEIPVMPMIANGEQIKNLVVPMEGTRGAVNALNGFIDYGKLVLHIVKLNENDPNINNIVAVESDNLINIQAISPLGMSDFIGSDYINQAIYTNSGERDASIFFGNSMTTLVASGKNVRRITAVRGNSISTSDISIINGEATIDLPNINVETTTPVEVDVEMNNGSKVTVKLNIKRTALFLEHGEYKSSSNQARVGYVLNKAYLYNNLAHSDNVFDAYLQVILYKGEMVVGYKQIKIDDEAMVNNLGIDQSGYMNTFDWDGFGDRPLYDPIVIYDDKAGDPVGVDRVSVFLTNGSISFDSDTLPSIEFGIGAGAQISWEAE